MTRALLLFLRGALLRCPVCGQGALYRKPLTYQANARCPSCGVLFMPDRGEVSGGMAITMVLTSILGVAGVVYVAFFTTLSPQVAVAVLAGLPTLFALWFYRHAHGLWIAALHLTHNLDEPHPLARQSTRRP